MADYDRDYDPVNADYDHEAVNNAGIQGAAIGGLIALNAFALMGIGAFFTIAAAEVGIALDITYTVGVDTAFTAGTTLTEGQIAIMDTLELIEAQGAEWGNFGGPERVLTNLIASWGLETLSADAFLALAAYNTDSNPHSGHYHNILNYGGFYGEALAPEDPGGPGSGHNFPTPPPHGGWVCYDDDDTHVTTCFFTPF